MYNAQFNKNNARISRINIKYTRDKAGLLHQTIKFIDYIIE